MADGQVTIKIDADEKSAMKRLEQVNKELNKIKQRQTDNTARKTALETEIANAGAAADDTRTKIETLKQQMSGMNTKSSGYKASKEELQDLQTQYKEQIKALNSLMNEYDKLNGKMASDEKATTALESESGQLTKTLSDLQAKNRKVNLAETFQGAGKSLNTGFKSILKWGFGIRSLFVLVRRLRSTIKEAVTDFAKQDSETRSSLVSIKGALAELKGAWGAAFAPILNAVAPIITALVGKLAQAAYAVQRFFAILSGKGSIKKAVANTKKIADGMSSAAGSAKEASKQLMNIDELNVMSDSGGSGSGSDVMYEEEQIEGGLGRIGAYFSEVITKTKEWFANLNFEPLQTAILGLKDALGGLFDAIAPIMVWLWTEVILPFGKWLIEKLIPALINILIPVIETISVVIQKLTPILKALWDELLKPLIEWIEEYVVMIAEDIATYIGYIRDIISDVCTVAYQLIVGIMKTICAIIKAIATGDWKTALNQIKQIWTDIWTGMKTSLRNIINSIIGLLESFVNTVVKSVNKVLDAVDFVASVLGGTVAWRINTVSFPRLAKGGIVDSATPFIAGEAGKEAVIPLERNTGWIKTLAEQIVTALPSMPSVASGFLVPPNASGGGADSIAEKLDALISKLNSGEGIVPVTVMNNMYLDRKKIGEAVTEYQLQKARAMG